MKVMEIVGSSIVTYGSACGSSPVARVSPTLKLSEPATA
jgi:hypothetical protein